MKSFRFIILSFAIVACAGCSPRLYPSHSDETSREVSDTIKETIRDTVYYAEPDSTILSLLIECDERGKAQLKEINQLRNSQRAVTTITSEPDNKMVVKTVVDSMGIYLQFRERYHFHEEKETKSVSDVQIVKEEVNVLYPWQKIMIWLGVYGLIRLMIFSIKVIARLTGNPIIK